MILSTSKTNCFIEDASGGYMKICVDISLQ